MIRLSRRGGPIPADGAAAHWAWRACAFLDPIPALRREAPPGRTELGAGLALYHDGAEGRVEAAQTAPLAAGPESRHAVALRYAGFDGSYLSLVAELPAPDAATLRRRHILSVDLAWTAEPDLPAFLRLNIAHGPNVETDTRQPERGATGKAHVEFELLHWPINESRITGAWLDLIFTPGASGAISVGDLRLSRSPRAEF